MSISFGNKNVKEMYFGNKKVAKVYFGNKLVWPAEGPVKVFTLDPQSYGLLIRIRMRSNTSFNVFQVLADRNPDGSGGSFAIFAENGIMCYKGTGTISKGADADKPENAPNDSVLIQYELPESFTFKAYKVYYVFIRGVKWGNKGSDFDHFYYWTEGTGNYLLAHNGESITSNFPPEYTPVSNAADLNTTVLASKDDFYAWITNTTHVNEYIKVTSNFDVYQNYFRIGNAYLISKPVKYLGEMTYWPTTLTEDDAYSIVKGPNPYDSKATTPQTYRMWDGHAWQFEHATIKITGGEYYTEGFDNATFHNDKNFYFAAKTI